MLEPRRYTQDLSPKSSRLVAARSFGHIRHLILSSSALVAGSSTNFNRTRFPSGARPLELDTVSISIDVQQPIEAAEDDGSLRIISGQARLLFARLNPKELVIYVHSHADFDPPDTTYIMSQDAAHAISRWSRLESVHLDAVNILTMPPYEDDDEEEPDESDAVFFLSNRGDLLRNPGNLDIVWDLSSYLHAIPDFGYEDVLDLLLHRDDTLQQSWVKTFTVIVRTEEIGQKFQALIDECTTSVPECLKWKTMEQAAT